jgi:RimJ/RimL family protein N-acetyltransferase
MIETARLNLIPAYVDLARAELEDVLRFSQLLGAKIPATWPPETLRDALPLFLTWLEAEPTSFGWFGWYVLLRGEAQQPNILVASVGFKGAPQNGTAELGYSVLPEYQGRGFATEMVRALVMWAWQNRAVHRLLAQSEPENRASIRVMEKCGFHFLGPGCEPGHVLYACERPAGH